MPESVEKQIEGLFREIKNRIRALERTIDDLDDRLVALEEFVRENSEEWNEIEFDPDF